MIIDRIEWKVDGLRKLAVGGWKGEFSLWPLRAYACFPRHRGEVYSRVAAWGFHFGWEPARQERGLTIYWGLHEWCFYGHISRPWGPGRTYHWLSLHFTRSKP